MVAQVIHLLFIFGTSVFSLTTIHVRMGWVEGLGAGLWILMDSIRIRVRIQHFSSIRIRIHKIFESGSNADPDPQREI
jgi:hypothetical protein